MATERRAVATEVTGPPAWGWDLVWAETDAYVGKLLFVRAGESLSLQYHEQKEETLYLLSGRVLLTLRDGRELHVKTMEPNQAYHIPPRLIHRLEAVEDSDVLEVSTPELDDVIRLEDRYGRQGRFTP